MLGREVPRQPHRSVTSLSPAFRWRIISPSRKGLPRTIWRRPRRKNSKFLPKRLSRNRSAAQETSKQLGRGTKLLALARKKKTLAVGIGLGLLGVVGTIVLTVIIRVRHPDGKETVVHVPEGSDVNVSKDGQVDVTLPNSSPLPLAGEGQGVRVPSPFIGADGKWKLPPGAPRPPSPPSTPRKPKSTRRPGPSTSACRSRSPTPSA